MPVNVRLCFGQPCSPCESGRFRRPSPRSAYTYTPSGASPAVIDSLSKVPPGFGPKQSRAWHPREFGAVLGVSASHTSSDRLRRLGLRPRVIPRSLRRRSRRRRGDTRRNASSVNTPPRLATCLTAHPTNRVVACRSVRHSPPSSLASPSIRRVFLRSFCARRRSVVSLNLARVSPGAKRSRRRRAQCGVQIQRTALVGAHLRGARFPAANPSPHLTLLTYPTRRRNPPHRENRVRSTLIRRASAEASWLQ